MAGLVPMTPGPLEDGVLSAGSPPPLYCYLQNSASLCPSLGSTRMLLGGNTARGLLTVAVLTQALLPVPLLHLGHMPGWERTEPSSSTSRPSHLGPDFNPYPMATEGYSISEGKKRGYKPQRSEIEKGRKKL